MIGLLRVIVAGLVLAAGQMATLRASLAPDCRRAADGGVAASQASGPSPSPSSGAHVETPGGAEDAADAADAVPCSTGAGLPVVGPGASRAVLTASPAGDPPRCGASVVRSPPRPPPRLG